MYRFLTADGRVCCSNDRADVTLFCQRCRPRLEAQLSTVPPPPSLMTAIAASRNPQPVTGWWTPKPERTFETAQVQLTTIAQRESRRLTALRAPINERNHQ
jgi:hypothetical protein